MTLGLASAAMQRGLRTLVIDLDPQCNTSYGLGAVGDFEVTAAEVIKKPRHNTVSEAILVSSWAKGQTGKLDVMVGHSRLTLTNGTQPSFKKLWNLEQALAKVEPSYDLVLIDTPPSINALTRLAWVASDRVLLVTEPTINSVISVETAIKALNELRRQVNRNVSLMGVVINRLRTTVPEHQFRVNELEEMYSNLLFDSVFEEKSVIAQAQGSGRAIHSFPGQTAAKIAAQFDALLNKAMESFASEDIRRIEQTRKSSKSRYSKRTHESGKAKPSGRRSTEAKSSTGERVPLVEISPVSPEYQDKFSEALRQTMTSKQLKAMVEGETPQEEN
jgi:cellulose biosynthesis protein BcsQ